MSFKTLAVALAEALIEDLLPFTPYSMAVMADYGKVGGYAATYVEVRDDAEAFLDFCGALQLRERVSVPVLPELVLDRLMREEFFLAEQDALLDALKRAASALRTEAEAPLEHRARRLDREQRRMFDRLLHRGGIDPSMVLNEPQSAHPGGEKIYVASRHSVRLRDQICSYLADTGRDPVLAPESIDGAFDPDLAARDMARCVGGVFGLTPPKFGGSAGIPLDERLASTFDEILLAEGQLGRRLMILAQEKVATRLPERLRDKPLFTMREQEMDDTELSLFKTVASRTPWLAA